MGLIHSYALWNNKGGVGKSTITFHLAMRYAELHPQTKILVIDLCPQANSSMMFLGGGPVGEENIINFCKEATPRSVVGYLRKRWLIQLKHFPYTVSYRFITFFV